MSRADKIKLILEHYDDINTVTNIMKTVPMSSETIRNISNALAKNGLLEKIEQSYQNSTKRYAYYATGKALTDELIRRVDLDVSAVNYERKNIPDEERARREAERAEKRQAKLDLLSGKKSPDELKGIYRLSSEPSKHFKDKFEAQSRLARESYKSPKNYAGTSAGMLW